MERACFLFLFYVIVQCVMNFSAMSSVTNITADQSALLGLKSLLTFDSHDGTVLVSNWSTTSSVCNWIGVVCGTRHKRVVALNLSNMGLIGTISPSIGNLSFLVSLDFSNNSFHGHLPQELARLRRLKDVNLGCNYFSGGLPSWFGFLPKLENLLLKNNSFTGTIPPSLCNISHLEMLSLRFNSLRGKIPQEIGNLHNLKWLNLGHNQLSGSIPHTMFNISSLQHIVLTNNSLTGNLPMDMCSRIPQVQVLLLSSNQVFGKIPVGLSGCSRLQGLSLSYNNFSGSIPEEIGNLTILKDLYLGNNNLRVVRVLNLTNICVHNKLLQTRRHLLDPDADNCDCLEFLTKNSALGIIPQGIGNLYNLKNLELNFNSLSGTIPVTIFNISTLRMISIVSNHLSGELPSFVGNGLPNLEAILLGFNDLNGTLPNSITNASKLVAIDLVSNYFTGPIPNSLGSLVHLEIINLGTNKFISESSSPELTFLTSLTNCRHLQVLWIYGNPLNGILPVSIGNFSTSIENIDASECGIKGNIPNEIGNLSSLAFLNIFGNDLTGYIPTTIKALRKLQVLHMNDNKIQGPIPDDLCQLHNLGSLSLRINQISGSVPMCLGNVTSLRYLYLSYNRLTASIPASLGNLNDLLDFNVSSNSFSGSIPPEIGNLKVAMVIDLSLNQFSGNIPSTIGGLQNLVHLSLADNRLQGPIPETFHYSISLEVLDLSHNNLTGVIPKSLEGLLHLRYFNVSLNSLTGEIPSGGPFKNFTNQSFWGNKALCGAPRFQVPLCHAKSVRGLTIKEVILVVFSTLLIALIMLTLTFVFVLKRCRSRNVAPVQTDLLPTRKHGRIPYHELCRATDGFNESNLLGMGSFGSVYKAILANGMILAIKVFNLQLEGAFKSFDTECEVLRNLRHRNLTKVISSCSNPEFKALVLEYMPNGSLEKWLYSHNHSLDILQRLDIMIDVACALDYLHHGYSTPVVHCDLKPSNVLLDEDMVAHLSDFGIAKLLGSGESIAQTMTLATFGYIAPEYGLKGLVSTRSDVYSFGIMLMETFTRMKPSDERFSGDLSLKRWVSDALLNATTDVMDANLLSQEEEHSNAKVQCVSSIMELALSCSAESPEERINMKDVLALLKKTRLRFLAT